MPTRWGEAIQRLLNERGWTQKRLAAAASVRPNTLTNIIKHGKHTDTATLTRIADAFGVDLGELFTSRDQSAILRAYHDNRIQRVAETVLSELSATVWRLVREDYEKMLGQEAADAPEPGGKARRRKRKTLRPET